MPKGIGRLSMMVGSIAYVALIVLALLTQMVNGVVFSWLTLGIIIQGILGVPFLLFLFRSAELPLVDYAKWFAAVVSVLAIAGSLGMPESALLTDPVSFGIDSDARSVREDLGAKKRLELAVDVAGAEDDDERSELRKKLNAVGDDLSDREEKELKRELDVLEAKAKLARWTADDRRAAIIAAHQRNGLIVVAAFLVLAGAYLTRGAGATA